MYIIYFSQIPTDVNEEENDASVGNTNITSNTQRLSNSHSSSNMNFHSAERNQVNSLLPQQSSIQTRHNEEDILESFESDDDFVQNIDYGKIDEIESTQGQPQEVSK